MIETVFCVMLIFVCIGAHVFAKTHGWPCSVCGEMQDFFSTPWVDERGLVGSCCLMKKHE